MAASEARHEKLTERILARFQRDTEYLADSISALRERQDIMERRFDRFINIAMCVIGVAALIVTAFPLYLVFIK